MKTFISPLIILFLLANWSCSEDDNAPSGPSNPQDSTILPTVALVNTDSSVINGAILKPDETFNLVFSAIRGNRAMKSWALMIADTVYQSHQGLVPDINNFTLTVQNIKVPSELGQHTFEISVTDISGNSNSTAFEILVSTAQAGEPIVVDKNISTDVTWYSYFCYNLASRIVVENGATLTIQPGTVIKAYAGTGANATCIIVARGGKIFANGTATAPIIFTSIADEITPEQVASGDFKSPNLDPDIGGFWGGLIILGRAPISISVNGVEAQIEGIPPSDTNGLYGGSDASDNSGSITYVSVRHSGSNIGQGNEINGITLGGVGNATVVENVEVVANQDDGIEWFGGTVNVTNALVWNSGDDAFDTDQGWAGTLDNFIVICNDDTDHALEIDGPEGTLRVGHTLINGSIKGHVASELGDFRDGAEGFFSNIYFFGFSDPAENGRGDLSLSGQMTLDNFTFGSLAFSNLEIKMSNDTIALETVFKNGTHVHATKVTSPTVGADKTVFGWTWAAQADALNDF